MIYEDDSEESFNPITEYVEKPTFMQTLEAGTKNFKAASMTTSASNYYLEERDASVAKWTKEDPANESLYKAIGGIEKNDLDYIESLYEAGKYDAIKSYNGKLAGRRSQDNASATKGQAYLAFKELQKQNGFEDPSAMRKRAEERSYNDFVESEKVLKDSDHWFAGLLGQGYGALHDPVTLGTLPLGTWKTGASLLGTAARAFGEEALIETSAQSLIMPTTLAYKQEIGIKTTLKEEAYNAAISIGSAGLVRGFGSAAFDLTAKGIKTLKVKDPELAAEYENLVKSQVTESVDEHIDNLHKTEFSGEPITEIKNPNAKGTELNSAKPTYEYPPEVVNSARMNKVKDKDTGKFPPEILDIDMVQAYTGGKGEVHLKAAVELDPILQKVQGDYEGPAIRGMLDTEGTLGKLEVGDSYTTRGVTSIAKDKETADTFVKRAWEEGVTGEKVYVNFESFTNKPVNLGLGNKLGLEDPLDITKTGKAFLEDEVVIPSGRSFEVVKKEIIGDETHFTVKEVETDTPSARPANEDVAARIEDQYISGTDVDGKDVKMTFKEAQDALDLEDLYIQKVKDCII